MFKTLKDAFQIKEMRHRIFYVLFILVVIRVGSKIPVPGVDKSFFRYYFNQKSNDAFAFLNAFTGGSLTNFSIFALSITPYITSSIIIQLLTIAIPKLEEMKRDGEGGYKKLAALTRYLTVGLALLESIGMCIGFGKRLILELNAINIIVVVTSLTTASTFLLWIGEQINDKGVGNGISMILLFNILSRIPVDIITLFEKFVKRKTIVKAIVSGIVIAVIILAVTVLVLILNEAERRIPVQYSKKMRSKIVDGQFSHIPLKVNTAGAIPIIFASSIMSFPVIIVTFTGKMLGKWGRKIITMLSSSNWFKPNDWFSSIGLILYVVLVFFFAYFYTSVTFNPIEVADNIKKQGGFIPGIRPGKATVNFLHSVLEHIIFIGTIGLVIVSVIPFFFNGMFNADVSFGGTALIIIVSVILETLKQMESMMLIRNYKGFLNN
ncbi:MAG: preprotein translocase subunit SecY [Lachnospiraceae bacterium]|nr:preprotein translocase subunit SecY [Lachnospiraceae bacterium]